MIRLPKSTLISILLVVLLMLGLNLWLERNRPLEQSDTSFGVGEDGYKAAYDLLRELDFPVNRAYFRSDRTLHDRTLWFVLPNFLYGDESAAKVDAADLLKWVRAGGTAIVMGNSSSDWSRLGLEATEAAGNDQASRVEGALAQTPRDIPITYINYFDKVDPHAKILLNAYGDPIAFELKEGAGRLIAVSEARFVQNWYLDQGDSSLLVVDLVRAFGPPDFDEHCHGLAPPNSSPGLWENPRLLLLLSFMLVTALLWIAEQRIWPSRRLNDSGAAPAPSVASFVDSLGVLYARANDPLAAFDAYRSSFLRRARRQFSPRFDMPEEVVIERMTRQRSLSAASRLWLSGDRKPSNENELIQAVRAIESARL